MAATTYTSTVFVNTAVKEIHAGDVTVSGQYNGSANSAGDIIFLAKIPHGARIVEFAVDHSSGETTFGMDYGMASGGSIAGGGADISQFATALAKATIIRKNLQAAAAGVTPPVVSVSDNSGVRYGIFGCKVGTASATTSWLVNFSVTYRCDA